MITRRVKQYDMFIAARWYFIPIAPKGNEGFCIFKRRHKGVSNPKPPTGKDVDRILLARYLRQGRTTAFRIQPWSTFCKREVTP